MWFLLLWSCTCRDTTPPVAPTPHYATFPALVDAVTRDRREAAQGLARDLTEGLPEKLVGDAGADEVGAALGFVQVATDGEDLAVGLARAAQGCGTCHGAHGDGPPAIPWSHPAGAEAMIGDLAWKRPVRAPVGEDEVSVRLAAAFTEVKDTGEADERPIPDRARVARVLMACQGCHASQE